MTHFFSVDAAMEFGPSAAVILQNICFWCRKNEANGKNFRDGCYWTYNSIEAFGKLFPYLTAKQIRGCLEKLEAGGAIRKGCFNEGNFDRTSWYAATQKGYWLCEGNSTCPGGQIPFAPEGKSHLPLRANGAALEGEPIPYIKQTDINQPDVNTDVCIAAPAQKGKREKPPKTPYGEFGRVLLTDGERESLMASYGESFTLAVEILDNYLESKGKQYKSHYAVMKRNGWVWDEVQKRKPKTFGWDWNNL